MKFTKMQGTGNDYIYINCFDEAPPPNPSELSKRLSDRHFGVGSDGVIIISPSRVANIKMDIYNSDGTRAEICGNGLRCVGKYVYERDIFKSPELSVETLAGLKKLYLNISDGIVTSVRVNMGVPILKPAEIPAIADGDTFINQPLDVNGTIYYATAVSVGNPHCIIFTDSLDTINLAKLGSEIERSPVFPERTNVEFAEVMDDGSIRARVWERGVGETLACGTGASAVLVAAVLSGECGRSAKIVLRGGELFVEWDEQTGEVYMTGGAEFVFDGNI